jgi:hypothetical protein
VARGEKQITALRRIQETASSAHFIEYVARIMRRDEDRNPEQLLPYFRMLTPQAIDPLCSLLGELDSVKWRKVICDFLASLAAGNIKPLVRFLSDPNPVVVFHVLYILGKVGDPTTVPCLAPLVNHRDRKVRDVTLHLLIRFGETGVDLIRKFLKDPVAEIRARASVSLGRIAKDHAVRPLMEIVLSEDFHKRAHEEKAAFFRALGETRSKEAIPFLQEIAQKKNWFKGSKWNEMRPCAVIALKMMTAEDRPVVLEAPPTARPV